MAHFMLYWRLFPPDTSTQCEHNLLAWLCTSYQTWPEEMWGKAQKFFSLFFEEFSKSKCLHTITFIHFSRLCSYRKSNNLDFVVLQCLTTCWHLHVLKTDVYVMTVLILKMCPQYWKFQVPSSQVMVITASHLPSYTETIDFTRLGTYFW